MADVFLLKVMILYAICTLSITTYFIRVFIKKKDWKFVFLSSVFFLVITIKVGVFIKDVVLK